MTLSDDLSKLSARAKEAEDRFAAAQQAAHDKVELDVKSARESLDKRTEQLRKSAETNKGKVAAWWNGVLKSWDEQIASIRRDIESKKAEHDLKTAQRKADSAEEDAEFAIQYAYWAVEQAEYVVLDAQLANGCRQFGGVQILRTAGLSSVPKQLNSAAADDVSTAGTRPRTGIALARDGSRRTHLVNRRVRSLGGFHPARIGRTGPPSDQPDGRGHDQGNRERGDDVNVEDERRANERACEHRGHGQESAARSRPGSAHDRAVGRRAVANGFCIVRWHHRGLAGAVRAEQHEHRTLGNAQVDAVEHDVVAIGLVDADSCDRSRVVHGRLLHLARVDPSADARWMTMSPKDDRARTSMVRSD